MDEDLLCAAVLHDLVEETSTTILELTDSFGARVGSLVTELTRREPLPDETNGLSKAQVWSLRSKMLLDEIAQMSPDAQQVKLADRLSNLRGARLTKRGEKLERYRVQTAAILKLATRSVNRRLWDAIDEELRRQRA